MCDWLWETLDVLGDSMTFNGDVKSDLEDKLNEIMDRLVKPPE